MVNCNALISRGGMYPYHSPSTFSQVLPRSGPMGYPNQYPYSAGQSPHSAFNALGWPQGEMFNSNAVSTLNNFTPQNKTTSNLVYKGSDYYKGGDHYREGDHHVNNYGDTYIIENYNAAAPQPFPQQQYTCDVCDKPFARSDALEQHRTVTTFSCPRCKLVVHQTCDKSSVECKLGCEEHEMCFQNKHEMYSHAKDEIHARCFYSNCVQNYRFKNGCRWKPEKIQRHLESHIATDHSDDDLSDKEEE
jgi:hypothetical protein